MSDEMSIMRATTEDICEDVAMGDMWTLRRLQVDRRVAVEAATQRWGPHGTSILPGELLWRLRVDETVPVYLSICPDEPEPIVMFNFYCRPPRSVEEAVLDQLGDMLTRDDDDDD